MEFPVFTLNPKVWRSYPIAPGIEEVSSPSSIHISALSHFWSFVADHPGNSEVDPLSEVGKVIFLDLEKGRL